jgi:hypothetical protein
MTSIWPGRNVVIMVYVCCTIVSGYVCCTKGFYITSCFHRFMLIGCGSISGNSSLFTNWYGTCTSVICLRLGYNNKCWLKIYWPPWYAFPCTMWPVYFFNYSRQLLSNAVTQCNERQCCLLVPWQTTTLFLRTDTSLYVFYWTGISPQPKPHLPRIWMYCRCWCLRMHQCNCCSSVLLQWTGKDCWLYAV